MWNGSSKNTQYNNFTACDEIFQMAADMCFYCISRKDCKLIYNGTKTDKFDDNFATNSSKGT